MLLVCVKFSPGGGVLTKIFPPLSNDQVSPTRKQIMSGTCKYCGESGSQEWLVEQCNQNDCILRVSGVIDDDKRLFVVDDSENPFRLNKGREFEIPFSKVTCQWRKVT